jgi:hypothetical protein
MSNNPKYNISPLLSGALFNGESVYTLASASLSIESNLTANAIEILLTSSSLSVESNLTANAIEILLPSASFSIESDLTANAILLNPISLSIESNLTANAIEILLPSAALSIESDLTANGVRITSVSASLDGILNISVTTPIITVLTGIIALSSSFNLLISDLIRFTPSSQNPGSLIPLVLLDGVALTDQNRKFDNSNKPVFVEKKNWNSSKSRYYKRSTSGKQSFKLSWEWLPSDREYTIDKRQARNYLKSVAMDPDAHTLTIIKYGENPEDVFEETEYNVFITNYAEDLIRRDLVSGVYFWKCDIEFEEL